MQAQIQNLENQQQKNMSDLLGLFKKQKQAMEQDITQYLSNMVKNLVEDARTALQSHADSSAASLVQNAEQGIRTKIQGLADQLSGFGAQIVVQTSAAKEEVTKAVDLKLQATDGALQNLQNVQILGIKQDIRAFQQDLRDLKANVANVTTSGNFPGSFGSNRK